MIKGAIFDLDGTILDSMSVWETLGEDYLKSIGKEPKENLNETFKTFSIERAAKYYIENYGVTMSVEEIKDGINKFTENFYKNKVQLKPGVETILKKLKEKGVKMCIATASDKKTASFALERLGVKEYFSEIFTCDTAGNGKDKPDIYRMAQKHLGTKKRETAVFEDALYALNTAKNDGFVTVGVFDFYGENSEKIKKTADSYVEDFNDFDKLWRKINTVRTVLTIAGSDSCGGAGIQADIKTMTVCGVYAMSAITALTAQNTLGVRSISEVSPEFLKEQIDAVFEDIFPDAVKIGMLPTSELVSVTAERLKYYNAKNIVADPVMVATSGSALVKSSAVEAMTELIFPIATLITPNIPEAEVLSGFTIKNESDMEKAAKIIGDAYGCAVLLKGGHNVNEANDLFYKDGTFRLFKGKRINNPNTHGTGCTLSSAIATYLSKGYDIETSIQKAKEYVSGAVSDMLDLGNGSGPLNHCFEREER